MSHKQHINLSMLKGIETAKVKQGLVFGKFMPPTNGHLYMINFAKQSCENLTILICSLKEEPISGDLRYKWLKELFPDCNVVHQSIDIKQEPDSPEDQAFFNLWRDSIRDHCPGINFDALFASETYGYKMGEVLECSFIPVDVNRDVVQISATKIRNDPYKYWDYLNPVIRPYFLKRVAVIGSELSGKNDLVQQLSTHFETSYVSNYTESLLKTRMHNIKDYSLKDLKSEDISTIARGQMASEKALTRQARKVLFSNSDLISIKHTSEFLFKTSPNWIDDAITQQNYDFYILLDPRNIDIQNNNEMLIPALSDRVDIFNALKADLDKRQEPYVIINNKSPTERFTHAMEALCEFIPDIIPA